jgi:NADH dehydrogenase
MSKKIIIVGGGVAGAQALKFLSKKFKGHKGYSFSVVDKQNYTCFTPMLHEVATGAVLPTNITFPIRQIIPCCVHQAEVVAIDPKKQIIVTKNKAEISYDYLVLAMGTKNNFYTIPGAEEYTLTLKSMQDAVGLRERLITTFEKATRLPRGIERENLLHFVIVGGGYTGVETAGQLAELFRKDFKKLYPEITPDEPKITLVQGGERILPILSERSSHKAKRRLEELGVNVHLGNRVAEVTKSEVILDNKETIQAKNVIWASGVMARGGEFFPEEDLERGRIKVNESLQFEKYNRIFVIGDLAAVMDENGPDPQTAQVAVQQSKVCAENLYNLVHEKPLKRFVYKHKGDLIPIGDRWAVAEIGPFKFTGFFAFWLRRTVYLQGIYSWSDKIRIVINWTMNLFTKRDITQL